jgi:hypothetical protein
MLIVETSDLGTFMILQLLQGAGVASSQEHRWKIIGAPGGAP